MKKMFFAISGGPKLFVVLKSKNQEECIVAYKCVSCKTKPTEPTAHRGEAIEDQSREKLGTSLSGEEIVT